jgi:N-acyl-L-homoserine lactone synthetase
MIRYILGTELWMHPNLARTMFRDRAQQFSKRLKWNVDVDRNGFERDQYDDLNPIYVLIEDMDGNHSGSMRLLPTTGRTMINEHFATALNDGPLHDPKTLECTRFCLSPNSNSRTALKLFSGAGRLMQELGATSFVAVFDSSMQRKYRLSGVPPEILGETVLDSSKIIAGRWHFDSQLSNTLMARAKLDPTECELALANSSLFREPYKVCA